MPAKKSTSTPEVTVYPNPVGNYLYITYNQGYQTLLYSTDGRLVSQSRHNAGAIQPIDLSNVPSGVYFLRLIGDDGVMANKKIVVSK